MIEEAIREAVRSAVLEMVPMLVAELSGRKQPESADTLALIDAGDIVERLGLATSNTIRSLPGFPSPLMTHPKRWLAADVERWATTRPQSAAAATTGRKRKALP